METAGLVDLQVNGFAGIDFNDAAITAAALDHALAAMAAHGVTTCLPTLITAPEAVLAARLAALDRAAANSRLAQAMVPGWHLEGPFLNASPGYAGCHDAAAMIDPDPALLARLSAGLHRPILMLTLAPERANAMETIRAARARGMLVALGHTAATSGEVRAAIAAGAQMATHLGNALPSPQPKFANPLIAQLSEDALAASFIADGIHIPPEALKVLLRAKTPARSVLVTDATAAAAAPPGLYSLAGMAIEHTAQGAVHIPGTDRLAGSALTLDRAVANLIAWGFVPPDQAIAMASHTPAALLAPALAAHGLAQPAGRVRWGVDWTIASVHMGPA